MQRPYPTEVFWSDEDEGFIALARDLPGCSAWGETPSDALGALDHAIEAWIEAARQAGNPIPAPSRRDIASRHSGRILLRLPKSLHARLALEADEEGISLNQYLVSVLSERHEGRAAKASA